MEEEGGRRSIMEGVTERKGVIGWRRRGEEMQDGDEGRQDRSCGVVGDVEGLIYRN